MGVQKTKLPRYKINPKYQKLLKLN